MFTILLPQLSEAQFRKELSFFCEMDIGRAFFAGSDGFCYRKILIHGEWELVPPQMRQFWPCGVVVKWPLVELP